jgi:hypothetical protein
MTITPSGIRAGETVQVAKPDEVNLVIEKAVNDYIRPETGAIFAYPPSLVFKAPDLGGDTQLMVGLVLCKVVGGVEDTGMSADDLIRIMDF